MGFSNLPSTGTLWKRTTANNKKNIYVQNSNGQRTLQKSVLPGYPGQVTSLTTDKHVAVGLFFAQFHAVDLKPYLSLMPNLDLEPRYSLDDTHRKPLKTTGADSTYGGK